MNPNLTGPSMPWWRVYLVWLVIGGPLIVVVASFATLGLALRHSDPVLDPVLTTQADGGAQQPALAARNHATMPRR